MGSDTAQQDFQQLAEDYFSFRYREDPVFATWQGIHDYDHILPDLGLEWLENYLAGHADFVARLDAMDQSEWLLDDQIDATVLAAELRQELRIFEHLNHLATHPETYIYYPLRGVHQLLIRDFAPLEQRLESAMGRLSAVPELLAQARQNLRRPAKVFTETAIEAAEDSLAFYRQMVPAAAAEVPSLSSEIASAAERAAAAFEDYTQFLKQDVLPRSDGDFSIGTELFEEMLHDLHFLAYSAEEMLEVGHEQYASIRRRMRDLAKEIDRTAKLDEVLNRAKGDYPPPDELLETYRAEMIRARDFALERGLVTVPVEEQLEFRETPPGVRGIIPYAMYLWPAPFEEQQLGTFFVTPIDMEGNAEQRESQLRFHSRHMIPVVALHEAYPGHHLQFVWANTNPSLVRKQLWSTLYVEGWAFYCEELMQEHGFLADPRSRLLRLDAELWRAARIIIDVSLHTQGMSVEEGIELLVESGQSKTGAKAEVRRYTIVPTQPMSYLIGKLEIMKLAERYRAERGEGFDLAEFHEALLRCGSIPPALAGWQLFGKDAASHPSID